MANCKKDYTRQVVEQCHGHPYCYPCKAVPGNGHHIAVRYQCLDSNEPSLQLSICSASGKRKDSLIQRQHGFLRSPTYARSQTYNGNFNCHREIKPPRLSEWTLTIVIHHLWVVCDSELKVESSSGDSENVRSVCSNNTEKTHTSKMSFDNIVFTDIELNVDMYKQKTIQNSDFMLEYWAQSTQNLLKFGKGSASDMHWYIICIVLGVTNVASLACMLYLCITRRRALARESVPQHDYQYVDHSEVDSPSCNGLLHNAPRRDDRPHPNAPTINTIRNPTISNIRNPSYSRQVTQTPAIPYQPEEPFYWELENTEELKQYKHNNNL
eukprot:GHVU01125696.1.p1 GENE.GHVU01125696.1~~GHVU01125696.1.p1  ORF type:complete len:352 (+),score=12.97 GHVU01125696.1:84-1058(+)